MSKYIIDGKTESVPLRLGLEPKWLSVKHGKDPWDRQLRSHTCFQDLMEPRLLMAHNRKNSVGDKVIDKKRIYLERNTLHRENVGYLRGWVGPQNVVLLTFMGWVISQANEWEDYSNYLGGGIEISRNWATAHFWSFVIGLGTVMAHLGVWFNLLICYREHKLRIKVWLKSTHPSSWNLVGSIHHLRTQLVLINLCPVLRLCHSFKGCTLPSSFLFQG